MHSSRYDLYFRQSEGLSKDQLIEAVKALRAELTRHLEKIKQLEADLPEMTAKEKFMIKRVKQGNCAVRTDTHYCFRLDHKRSPGCELAPFPTEL